MTIEQAIQRWAKFIVPTVFRAEAEMLRKHPELEGSLRNIPASELPARAAAYSRAVAEEVVVQGRKYDPDDVVPGTEDDNLTAEPDY
jgi:hypothetical protein